MERTRKSLYYLAGYLIVGGVALLLVPDQTLKFLLSNGDYGQVFPRLAGMCASGLGMSIAGIIRARAEAQYTGTLLVRTYFVACLVSFYWMTRDPLFLVVLGVVLAGMALTGSCYLLDSRSQRAACSAK
jgi:hypothetical protein